MIDPAPTVLVVDDADYAFAIRKAVESAKLDWNLQVVGDGHQAVVYLVGQKPYLDRKRYPLPSLVLVSYHLTRKSGLGLLSWIRSQPGLKRLPVVILGSSEDRTDVNRAYDLGANSYLIKPRSHDALVAMLQTVATYWHALNRSPDVEV